MGAGSGLWLCGPAGALGWPGAVRQTAEGGASRTAYSKACRLGGQKSQVCAGTKEGTGNLLKINLVSSLGKQVTKKDPSMSGTGQSTQDSFCSAGCPTTAGWEWWGR